MIVIVKQVPASVLEQAVIEDVTAHRASDATRGTLLLPASIRNSAPVPDVQRIAWEYHVDELTPSFLELMRGNILGDISVLAQSTRIPYTLFMYSDAFYRNHRHQLQFGHTAQALIQKLTAVRK